MSPSYIGLEIEVSPATPEEKPVLQRLLQFYLHDLSEFHDAEMGEDAVFREFTLDSYFADSAKAPFLIRVNGKLAGFALISGEVLMPESEGGKCINEFFVLRRYRGMGVGQAAVGEILSMAPSRWEVRVVEQNHPALHFWQAALQQHTTGSFSQHHLNDARWKGPVFTFAGTSKAMLHE